MEVVIIFVVVGIIGYVIYQSLPNPKFQKAISLFNSGNLLDATKILNGIFEKHPDAPAKFAECKLKEGLNAKPKSDNQAIMHFKEAIEIKKSTAELTPQKTKYELVEAKACYEIALIQFSQAISITNADSKVKNLKDNLRFIDTWQQNQILTAILQH
jgi:tetratricopeptide (TPR) repeat protein